MPSIGSIVRLGLVVAAATASSATSMLCEPVERIENRSFFVQEDDPEHRAALESCLSNDAFCAQLCDDLLGVPQPGYTRTIRECFLLEEAGGYRVQTQYHLTGPCGGDELLPDADWGWYPDAAQHDAEPVYDAAPAPDAAPEDATL